MKLNRKICGNGEELLMPNHSHQCTKNARTEHVAKLKLVHARWQSFLINAFAATALISPLHFIDCGNHQPVEWIFAFILEENMFNICNWNARHFICNSIPCYLQFHPFDEIAGIASHMHCLRNISLMFDLRNFINTCISLSHSSYAAFVLLSAALHFFSTHFVNFD